jgi:hypothetical protein
MNTNTNAQRAYVEAIISRLHRQYDEQVPVPAKDEYDEGEPLSAELLQRLYRHVISEGYGE